MSSHYLHLVKLGITLKYVKKKDVDTLLETKEFSILKKYLKKTEWQNLWRIYIENSIASAFVKHGFLDKKLLIVMVDDLILKAKQGKAITGPMSAVQKNLLGQKIVDRSFTNIIAPKVNLPQDVKEALYKTGFLTGDNHLFGFGFEDIEEVEPIATKQEIQKEIKQEAKTVVADNTNREDTQRINYDMEQLQENVVSDEKTTILYKQDLETTNEICRDLVHPQTTLQHKHLYWLAASAVVIIAGIILYFVTFSTTPFREAPKADTIIASISKEKSWRTMQRKYWQAIEVYSKFLRKLPQDQTVLQERIKCIYSFYRKSLKKKKFYLANALKSEYIHNIEVLELYKYISQNTANQKKKEIEDKFKKAVKN